MSTAETTQKVDPLTLLASATPAQARKMIRCGLEFEFHALNGMDEGDLGSTVLRKKFDSEWKKNPLALITEDSGHGCDEFDFISTMRGLGISLKDLRGSGRIKIQKYMDRIKGDVLSDYVCNNRVYNEDYSECVQGFSSISKLAECSEDGSVSGGEIRTLGAQTYAEFQKVCRVLTGKKNKWTVDDGCSFHIHLSLPGVRHKYGARFQAEMYAYLIQNMSILPKGVQKRVFGRGRKWAKLSIGNAGKSVAISYHPQGTWEFRLFGGISRYSDMVKCLDVAIATLQHAYRVRAGLSPSLISGIETVGLSRALDAVYEREAPTIPDLKQAIRVYNSELTQSRQIPIESDAA